MLLVYMAMMYLLVSPAVSIEMLYLPLFCRGFAQEEISYVRALRKQETRQVAQARNKTKKESH